MVVMRARLRGGIINKARRGELEMRLPIGFVYDADGHVRLDPDTSIQTSVRQLFSTFRRTGSAVATVKEFREQGLQFPRRISHGPNKGDVVWNELQHSRVLWILHHPRYAGAFCFGRTHIRLHPDGHQTFVKLAPEEWTALIRLPQRVAAVVLTAVFPQDRVGFLFGMLVWASFWSFASTLPRASTFVAVAGKGS